MPRFKQGQQISYAGLPMTVALVVEVENPPNPAHGRGTYIGLRTPEMAADSFFLLPEHEVAFAADLAAQPLPA